MIPVTLRTRLFTTFSKDFSFFQLKERMRHKRALKETDLIFSLQTPFLSPSVTPDLSHTVIFAHSTIDERDTGNYTAANRIFQTPIRVVLARYLNFYYV